MYLHGRNDRKQVIISMLAVEARDNIREKPVLMSRDSIAQRSVTSA